MADHPESAFISHDSFESDADEYRITTTAFETTASVSDDSNTPLYTVEVTVPTLQSATEDDVGPTVAADWLETFERRLEAAPKATRSAVELEAFDVTASDETVTIRYGYHWETPRTAVDIAKTFAEYVEGTYVEGVIPGYEYTGQVAALLGDASQSGDGGTPL
jgi:hypothetical protein